MYVCMYVCMYKYVYERDLCILGSALPKPSLCVSCIVASKLVDLFPGSAIRQDIGGAGRGKEAEGRGGFLSSHRRSGSQPALGEMVPEGATG